MKNSRISLYEIAKEKITSVSRAYESDDSDIRIALELMKAITGNMNKELIPKINREYWYDTCGSHSHFFHPVTECCFICNTNNHQIEECNGT